MHSYLDVSHMNDKFLVTTHSIGISSNPFNSGNTNLFFKKEYYISNFESSGNIMLPLKLIILSFKS